MRLLLLFGILCIFGRTQRMNNETYKDVKIALKTEIYLRDPWINIVLQEPSDPFEFAIWYPGTHRTWFWTNGPQDPPQLYTMDWRDLLGSFDNDTFPFRNTSLPVGEYSVQAGVYNDKRDELVLAGSRILYKYPSVSNSFQDPDSSFIFPDFILPFTAYYNNDSMFIPQWRGINQDPPYLNVVDWPFWSDGPDKSRKYDLQTEQLATATVDATSGYVFLGSRTGSIQVRNTNSYFQALVATITIKDAVIVDIAFDPLNKRLFIACDYGESVLLVRLDVQLGIPYWDGNVIDPAQPLLFDDYTTVTTLIQSGSGLAMAIDVPSGTGFVSMVDNTGLGFLAKVNLRTGELAIVYLPIERENSRMTSIYLEQYNGERLLYAITTYTVAVFNYSTACSLDCREAEGKGVCIDGRCECEGDWWGLSCSTPACHPGCGDYEEPFRGECINGKCVCQANFTGDGCEERRCPNDCSGNGYCNNATDPGNYTCTCIDIRTGPDCSELRFQSCEEVNDYIDIDSRLDACLDLTQYLGCGYCGGGHSLCIVGNRAGPMNNSCVWWFYDGAFNPAFLVLIAIMMFAWICFFTLDGYSMLAEDLRFSKQRQENQNDGYCGTKHYQKILWWRDERSMKAWKLFDQMQFLAAYGVINALFTTELYNFLTFWNFSLFLIPWGGDMYYYQYDPTRAFNYTPPAPIDFPFPSIPDSAFGTPPSTNNTRRALEKRDYQQFLNSVETKGNRIFPTCVSWICIVMASSLLAYLLWFFIVTKMVHAGKEAYKKIHTLRFLHIFFRVLHAAYFPAIFLGVFAIQVVQDGVIALAVVVGLIWIGIGVPLFFFLLTKDQFGELTEWFDPQLRIRFGSFYASYRKNRIRFQLFVFFRKAWMACSLGAMARGYDPDDSALFWAQMIVTLVAIIIYQIILLWKRPYIDTIHLIVDSVINILNGVTLLLSLLAIQSDPGTQEAIQWIVLIVQIPCAFLLIAAYLWSCVFYYGYTKVSQVLCCKGKPDIPEDDKRPIIMGGATTSGSGGAKKPQKYEVSDTDLANMSVSD